MAQLALEEGASQLSHTYTHTHSYPRQGPDRRPGAKLQPLVPRTPPSGFTNRPSISCPLPGDTLPRTQLLPSSLPQFPLLSPNWGRVSPWVP